MHELHTNLDLDCPLVKRHEAEPQDRLVKKTRRRIKYFLIESYVHLFCWFIFCFVELCLVFNEDIELLSVGDSCNSHILYFVFV